MKTNFSNLKIFMTWGLTLTFGISTNNAQVTANKEGGKHQAYADSLKNSKYPYILPIWGDKVTKMGISLPYSAGVGINYIYQESELVIDNLQVGFNNGEMHDLDQVVKFNQAKSTGSVLNFRPDVWVLPFLNVYAVLAKSQLSTFVDYSIYVPDSLGNSKEAIRLTSDVAFQGTSFGFGMTPTFGVRGYWIALDMNFTWNDIPSLSKPAFAFVFGPRVGKSFKFKKPESNIAFWVGGFRLHINTDTEGSLLLKDVLPVQDLQPQVDEALVRVDEAYTQVDTWWNNLTPAEQKNPINAAKYERANSALDKAAGYVESMDEALNDDQYASVQYSLDKKPKDMWNFLIGSQYQYNKHWMIRAEYGFLSSRKQILVSLQYRFGL